MIRFTLVCANDHRFDSWFASNDAFDGLHRAKRVECPTCGSNRIEKTLMAPRIAAKGPPPGRVGPTGTELRPGPAGEKDVAAALARLRKVIESNSEDVGSNFATEARAIHDGDSPARMIYGQAGADEARKLVEDGVPIAPLPFVPTRRTN